jgi:hypothetical protein
LWKLKVNADKTKVMVFGNGRLPQNLSFSYDNLNLEIVKNFNYLRIILTRTENFSLTKKYLADKALKAMYEVPNNRMGLIILSNRSSRHCIDSLYILPIFKTSYIAFSALSARCFFVKRYMVYGELERYPIYIDIKIRTVCYWARLIVGKQTKYSNILYRLCRQLNENHKIICSLVGYFL